MGYGYGGGGGGGYRGGNGGGYGGGGGGGQRQPFQKKEGEGKLFEEQNKRNQNSPDFSGYIIYNGEEIKFSGWQNQRGPGINLKIKTAQRQAPQGQQGGYGQPEGQRYFGNGDGQAPQFQPPPAGQGYGQPPPPVYGGPQPGYGQAPPQGYRPPNAVPMPPRTAAPQQGGWAPPQAPPQGQQGGGQGFQPPPQEGPQYGTTAPMADDSLPF